MQLKHMLAAGAALGTVFAWSAASADDTQPKPAHKHAVHAKAEGKMEALVGEVEALKANLAIETAARIALEAQLQKAVAIAQAAQTQAQVAEAQTRTADAAAIKTIPAAVAAQVDKAKPKTDALYVKGVKITLGGFIETVGVYRDHDTANDIATGLNTIPYPQSRQGHEQQFVLTDRQSRVSALIEGKADSDVTLSMYGEFDFQGAAQSSNSNESDSYIPRIRHLYGTADWANEGWHFLAGQSFSLVTLNSKGITPRNEVAPLTIDGQFVTGFTWTRQPGIRVTKDLFDHALWLAVSAENPQTTFTGTVPTGVINTINNGQGYYSGATNTGAAATQSLNHIPDFIAKAAVEEDLAGHHMHGEVYGLARAFSEQLPDYTSHTVETVGFGYGFTAQVIPGLLDVQASGLMGKGVGRYASGQLPDATFGASGHIVPIGETITLIGAILHPTKTLDMYAYGGQERDASAASGTIGYGNPLFVNSGCGTEGSTLTCTGNTRLLQEYSTGFWQKFYSGPWGQARVGVQYSYIERDAFSGVGGAPSARENMVFTSFRYYPFQ
jgi:hypothetical protein